MTAVEIKMWVPNTDGKRTLIRLRGTLSEIKIDNEIKTVEFSGGWFPGVEAHTEYHAVGQKFTLIGNAMPWKYDRHRVPQIGGTE
jgi:hypothetical protein